MTLRRSAWVLWTLLAAAWPSSARAAVADYLGKPIVSIRFVLENRDVDEPALVGAVETRAGQPLSMAAVRESLSHLYSLQRFEDVRVDATLAGNGVVLRYDLSPLHPVSKVTFMWASGMPVVPEDRLQRAVTERGGAAPQLNRSAELADAIGEVLRERGYLHPTVTPSSRVSHAPHRTMLTFAIDPGSRTVVGKIEIAGEPGVSRDRFLDELDLASGAPYLADRLNTRIDEYKAANRSRGYYNVRVTPEVALVDNDRVANVTLAVDRGPHVRLVFAGDPLPPGRRADLVPVEREGTIDEDLLEDSSNRIEEFLRAQGYRDAAAPHTRMERDGELVITFDVRRGREYRVARVEISGTSVVPLSAFEPSLHLREGTPFSASALDADVAAIEAYYTQAGFVGARADSGVEPQPAPDNSSPVPVVVRIVVREGVRTLVGALKFNGNHALDASALESIVSLKPDRPFVVSQLAADRDAIQRKYLNLGHANAAVDAKPETGADAARADVVFTIREGPQFIVDHVIIAGNARISDATIERELQVHPGEPLGRDAVFESQRRLLALGLFRRVEITELGHGNENRRDLLVTVEEAPMTTIAYGGGVEGRRLVVQEPTGLAGEVFQLAPRASFEIGRRNLFGKNRSATAFSSVSLPLNGTGTSPTNVSSPGVAEYRLLGTYREPRIFDTAADALLNVTMEQQIRSSFDFRRRSASAELARRLTPAWSVSGSYQIQRTEVFNQNVSPEDQLLIDRTFPKVLLSSFSLSVIRDTRNDQTDPSAGGLFSGSGQLAARAIGSKVGFVKSFFTAQEFRKLPGSRGVVFAGSARLGLADGFPREAVDDAGHQLVGPDGEPLIVDELYASERFYAGGDTTIRGFALDAVGVRHDPPAPEDTIDKDGFALGGNAVVILNGELRVPVHGGFGVVGFLDTGNVFQRVSTIDVSEFRTAVGFGVRYKSPIGPIRVDLGFKANRRPDESLTAWYITFGQAF